MIRTPSAESARRKNAERFIMQPMIHFLCAVLQETMTAEPGDMVRFTLLADKCLCFRSQQET